MPLDSADALFEALGRNPDEILGTPESQWLDFKGGPYWAQGTPTPIQKLELAKDVTAMANAEGGVILIGVATEIKEDRQVEVASLIRPLPAGLINQKQVEDVIEEWVVPRPEVRVRPHTHTNPEFHPNKQLWTIHIERGRPRDLPYLVSRTPVEDDASDPNRHLFGVYERAGTNNRGRNPATVHEWIHRGYIDDLESQSRPAPVPRLGSDDQVARMNEAEEALESDLAAYEVRPGEAYLSIQAMPLDGTIPNFYEGDRDSVYERLNGLRQIQQSGFNLPWRAPTERAGSGYRKIFPQHSSVSIMPSGLTTTILGEETLCWAYDKHQPLAGEGARLINPLTMPEFALETCRLYSHQVAPLIAGPHEAQHIWRVLMRGVSANDAGVRLLLPLRPINHANDTTGEEPRPAEDFLEAWEKVTDLEAERFSFEIMRSIYRRFGLSPTFIPYASAADSRISTERIERRDWRH